MFPSCQQRCKKERTCNRLWTGALCSMQCEVRFGASLPMWGRSCHAAEAFLTILKRTLYIKNDRHG